MLQSDDSATPHICAATSTVSSSTPSLFSHLSANILTLTPNVAPQVDDVYDCVYETDETKSCNCEEEIKRLKAENECLKTKVTSLEKTAIYYNQESVRLSQENTALRNKVEKNIFSVRNLDEKKLKFFTGKVLQFWFSHDCQIINAFSTNIYYQYYQGSQLRKCGSSGLMKIPHS